VETLPDTLRELAQLVDGIESPFSCGGELTPRKPVALAFADGAIVTLSRDDTGKPPASVRALISRASPAPFGKGSKTVHDVKVRKALQIKAAADTFTVRNFDPAKSGVLEIVRQTLTPRDDEPPTAELYNLNIYGPGGHFTTHKDTPRGSDMLGTLVVCLPARFQGGELELQCDDEYEAFDWSAAIEQQDRPSTVHWAAFFGDVDHAISEVSSGHRVTLSWILRRAAGSEPGAVPSELGDVLRRALADQSFLPTGGKLRFRCAHMYKATKDSPLARPVTVEVLRSLQGRDRDIAAAARALGLPTSLVMCLGDEDSEFACRLDRMPTRKDVAAMPAQMEPAHLERLGEIAHDVYTVPISGGDGEHAFTRNFSQTGYFGNEGGEASFYVFSALEIRVGAADDRLSRGRQVMHPKFGAGMVVGTTGEGPARALRVRFASGEERTILARFFEAPP
jgi:hypothetical protein